MLGRKRKRIRREIARRKAKAVVAKVCRTTQRISTRFRYMNYRASALPPELQEAYDDLVENWRKILLIHWPDAPAQIEAATAIAGHPLSPQEIWEVVRALPSAKLDH
jgi:hypothetical protein